MAFKDYTGKAVTIRYDAQRCIHARECVKGLGAVFDPQARPWIRPDQAAGAEVVAVIHRCPTGALAVRTSEGVDPETPDARNSVTIVPDGPLYLRGRVTFATAPDAPAEPRVALCRCGASKNKPFCDRSHVESAFRDGACLQKLPDDATPGEPAGTLVVKANPNGPLMIKGWFELKAADGKVFVAGEKTWLCRCGRSGNKPFCDGTHKKVGFQS